MSPLDFKQEKTEIAEGLLKYRKVGGFTRAEFKVITETPAKRAVRFRWLLVPKFSANE